MKHERGIRAGPKPTWWRGKTLARKLHFRPIEREDLRYIWAAYKKGSLASMGGIFADTGMEAPDFEVAFEAEIKTTYHGAWALFADTKKGFIPVGLVLAFWSHPDPRYSPFMIVGDMIWFPWASARNKIESAVNFFNAIRREIPMVEYADDKARRFFEVIAQHGIMRRVGTSFNVYPGVATAVFETRAP